MDGYFSRSSVNDFVPFVVIFVVWYITDSLEQDPSGRNEKLRTLCLYNVFVLKSLNLRIPRLYYEFCLFSVEDKFLGFPCCLPNNDTG